MAEQPLKTGSPGREERRGGRGYLVLAAFFAVGLVMGFVKEPIDWESNAPVRFGGVFQDMTSASTSAKAIAGLACGAAIAACLLWYWFSKTKQPRNRLASAVGTVFFILGSLFIFMFGVNVCTHDVVWRLWREGRLITLGETTFQYTEKGVPGIPGFILGLGLVLLTSAYLLQFRIKPSQDSTGP